MFFSGAGVLIFEVSQDKEMTLVLFHDKEKQAYVDPGGCTEKDHANPAVTAMIELFEETAGMMRVNDPHVLSNYYIDRETHEKSRKDGSVRPSGWYRSHILFTQRIDDADYFDNLKQLRALDAPKCMLETNDMVRINVSDLYRANAGRKKYVKTASSRSRKIRLHKRVRDLLHELFDEDASWIFKVFEETGVARYVKTQRKGLTMYEYGETD